MKEISQAQRNKIAELASEMSKFGDLAVLKKLVEIQDFVDYFNEYLISFKDDKDLNYKIANYKIESFKDKIEPKLVDMEATLDTSIKEVGYALNELELKVKGLINGSEGTSLSQIKELSKRLSSEINRLERNIPPDVSSKLDILTIELKKLKLNVPKLPPPTPPRPHVILDNPQQIADKINTLHEKIKPETIIGWNDLERRIKFQIPHDFDIRIGVSQTALQRLVARVVALENQISTGNGGSGAIMLTTRNTIDDSNTTFGFTNPDGVATLPTMIVMNGLLYRQNGGAITWTVSGTDIVLSSPVGTNGTIFGIFGGIIIEMPGVIDDSNTSFVSFVQPIYVIMNGAGYLPTSTITWTYTAGTTVLSSPVGTGGSVFGLSGISLVVDTTGIISSFN